MIVNLIKRFSLFSHLISESLSGGGLLKTDCVCKYECSDLLS